MNLVGMMLVKNEAWCLGYTLRVALRWCDSVVVLDHCSDDATLSIVQNVEREVGIERIGYTRTETPDDPWPEMRLRNELLSMADRRNPTHLAFIDGDEALTPRGAELVRSQVEQLSADEVLMQPMLCPYDSLNVVKVAKPFNDMPILLGCKAGKDLFYAPTEGYQHHARAPRPRPWVNALREGGCVHLQFASARRLRAKAVWYKMRELMAWPNRRTGFELDEQYDWTLHIYNVGGKYVDTPNLYGFDGLQTTLIDLEAEPWQERQARQWIADRPDLAKRIALHGLTPLEKP